MTTTARIYLDISETITADLDSRVNLDVLASETRVVVSGLSSAEAMRSDAPGLAVRTALRTLSTARRDARACRPERREHYASKATAVFEGLVAALVAAGVPAR